VEIPSGATIATTHARVGLIGNPSDGYGGAAIAFAFDGFSAELWLTRAAPSRAGFGIEWQGESVFVAESLEGALETALDEVEHGAARLILAALRMLARTEAARLLACGRVEIAGRSSIPLQAGLAGSSAIVISALRVLAERGGIPLDDDVLASLALRAETQELAIAAGPMDRIAQARGGLLFMDFAEDPPGVTSLDAALPEGLYVAWDRAAGAPSGRVHGALRKRFESGEPRVLEAMRRFRELAYEGRAAMERADVGALARLFDENFVLRRDVVGVAARDEAMVAVGRAHGAGVKLSGSGGAVVGLATPDALSALRVAHAESGFGWLQPRLVERSELRRTPEAASE
jgi:glucuronokinase